MALSTYDITHIVYDQGGLPVENAQVRVVLNGHAAVVDGHQIASTATFYTDANGSVTMPLVTNPTGGYYIVSEYEPDGVVRIDQFKIQVGFADANAVDITIDALDVPGSLDMAIYTAADVDTTDLEEDAVMVREGTKFVFRKQRSFGEFTHNVAADADFTIATDLPIINITDTDVVLTVGTRYATIDGDKMAGKNLGMLTVYNATAQVIRLRKLNDVTKYIDVAAGYFVPVVDLAGRLQIVSSAVALNTNLIDQ